MQPGTTVKVPRKPRLLANTPPAIQGEPRLSDSARNAGKPLRWPVQKLWAWLWQAAWAERLGTVFDSPQLIPNPPPATPLPQLPAINQTAQMLL